MWIVVCLLPAAAAASSLWSVRVRLFQLMNEAGIQDSRFEIRVEAKVELSYLHE